MNTTVISCADGTHSRSGKRRRTRPLLALLLVTFFSVASVSRGVTIHAAAGFLDGSGTPTTDAQGTAYTATGLSVDLNGLDAGNDVLLIANFSSKATASGLLGTWKVVMNGADDDDNDSVANFLDPDYTFVSDEMVRYMRGSPNDQGMISIVHIFEDIPAGDHTFTLYHRDNALGAGSNMVTYYGNIAAIPLVTFEEPDATLNYGIQTLAARDSVTSTSLEPVDGLSATVEAPAEGDLFVFAAFSAQTESANSQGEWQLSLWDAAGTSRIAYLSNGVTRAIATATVDNPTPNEVRDVTLTAVGVAQDVAPGTYTLKLEHRSLSGNVIYTANATLATVALMLEDGRQFAAYEQRGATRTTKDTAFVDGLTEGFELLEESDVLVASHFGASSNGAQGGYFRVGVDGSFSNQGELYIDDAADVKSGGNVGLIEANAAGTHTARLQYMKVGTTGQQLSVDFPVLVTILLNTEASIEGEGAIDLYRAYLHTIDRQTIVDTCRARNIGEARRAFEARHIGARIVSILYIRNARRAGYRLFLGGIRTADGRNLRDTCYALNPAQARRILAERYPGGGVNHMGLYPHNRRAVTWYGVTQRPDLFDELDAADAKAAHFAFSQRYPGERIVRVVQTSKNNVYHSFEGLVDPGEVNERVTAPSPAEAAERALARHRDHRVLQVSRIRSGDGIQSFEARVRIAAGGTVTDTCLARSASEARRILSDRHADGVVGNLQQLPGADGYEMYQAGVSGSGQPTFTDVTEAKTAAAAATILRGRYPDAAIQGVRRVDSPTRYRPYVGGINTANGRNARDTCRATSPAEARRIFLARFPGGEVRSVASYGNNADDIYDVTLRGTPTRERCQARDRAEALKLLANRFPNGRVASVRQLRDLPEQAVYRATINTRDHRTVFDFVEAASYSEARTAFLERFPGGRFVNLHRVSEGLVTETYQAQIDLPPARDTCQATTPAEARHYFAARYPKSSTGGLRRILTGGR